MKPALKAALLSAAVFPGAGQFYLKQYMKSAIIILLALVALVMVVTVTISNVTTILGKINIEDASTMDTATVMNLASIQSFGNGFLFQLSSWVIVCVWVFSIIDAYFSAARKDPSTSENTQPPL